MRSHGFKTILMGPEHPPYGAFCPAPGHQLGFNELKAAEVATLLEGIAAATPPEPGFRTAWQIAQTVDAILLSAAERRWIRPEEM